MGPAPNLQRVLDRGLLLTTERDRPTGLQIAPEVREQVDALVRAYVQEFADGAVAVYVPGLKSAIAEALQFEVNRAELAEMERKGAVDTLRRQLELVRELGEHGVAASWVVCRRCSARAASVEQLQHARSCSLSSYPPPRLSIVAPPADEEPQP